MLLCCRLFNRFDAHQRNTFSRIVSLSVGRWFMPLQTAWGELSHRFPKPRAVFLHHQLTSTSLESWIILWMLLWCSGIYAALDKQHFIDWLTSYMKIFWERISNVLYFEDNTKLEFTLPSKDKNVCFCNLSSKHNLICLWSNFLWIPCFTCKYGTWYYRWIDNIMVCWCHIMLT